MYVSKTLNIQSTCVFIKPEMNLSNLKFSKDYMNINIKLDKQHKVYKIIKSLFKNVIYICTKA